MAVIHPDAGAPAAEGHSLWRDALRRLMGDWTAVASFSVIVAYIAIAVFASVAFHDFARTTDYDARNQPPSTEYWFGTDVFGRSVLQKTLLGAKVSLTVGFMANAMAVPFGFFLGMVAGYFGKRVDDIVVWLYTTLASIPSIILLIALKFAFQGKVLFADSAIAIDLSGIHGMYIALAIMSWIGTCRIVRAETFKLKNLDYVTAAIATGQGHLRIVLRHITPNLLHLAIINFSLGFVGAITAEVILSFLGLGVDVGTPSWGTMINAARLDLAVGRWWEMTAACGAMFLIVLALSIFGDRLRDAFDPKLRK